MDFLKLFNPNNIFSNLNIVQVILFFACVLFAVLFGFLLGGCIFYPSAVKSYLKGRVKAKQDREKLVEQGNFYKNENTVLENSLFAPQQKTVADNVALDLSDSDFSFDDIVPESGDSLSIISDETDLADDIDPDMIIDEVVADVEDSDKAADSSKEAKSVFTDDESFNKLVENRKKDVPVIGRYSLLSLLSAHASIAPEIPLEVFARSKDTPFDSVKAGGCTFIYVYVRKKVLQLFLRLHINTYKATKEIMGNLISEATEFGTDWYSLILGEKATIPLVTKAIDLSYKYTAMCEFTKGANNTITRTGINVEEQLESVARSYNPVRNRTFNDASEELNGKYKLDYFGITEACLFTNGLKGVLPASATEFSGNRPAILKAGEHIFAILYENYGVLKVIFRSSEDYSDSLKLKHVNVRDSDFPVSRDWKWYSLIVDETYKTEEIKLIISDCYKYVSDYHKQEDILPAFDEEE